MLSIHKQGSFSNMKKILVLFALSCFFAGKTLPADCESLSIKNRENQGQSLQNSNQTNLQTSNRQLKQTSNQQQKSQQTKNQTSQSNRQKSSRQEDENEYKIAREGVGIEGIIVGKSTIDDVVKKFGKNYKWITHKKYSFQMAYPNGLSFYICQSDKKKQVFDIEIKPPYKAKTSRGIILGKSTVEDVYKLYGKSNSGLEYKGVHFYYTNKGGKKIITTIDIVERAGIRQCDKMK